MDFRQKKRKYDSNITDSDVCDFLNNTPTLYKRIQLHALFNKLTYNDIKINGNNPEELCLSIYDNIKQLVSQIYTDVEWVCDDEKISIVNSKDMSGSLLSECYKIYNTYNFIHMESFLDSPSVDDIIPSWNIFSLDHEVFNRFGKLISEYVLDKYNLNLRVNIDINSDYAICVGYHCQNNDNLTYLNLIDNMSDYDIKRTYFQDYSGRLQLVFCNMYKDAIPYNVFEMHDPEHAETTSDYIPDSYLNHHFCFKWKGKFIDINGFYDDEYTYIEAYKCNSGKTNIIQCYLQQMDKPNLGRNSLLYTKNISTKKLLEITKKIAKSIASQMDDSLSMK